MSKRNTSISSLVVFLAVLAACNPSAAVSPTADKEYIDTLLAQTPTQRMAQTDTAVTDMPTASRTVTPTRPATVTPTGTRTRWPTREPSGTLSLPPPDAADYSSAPCKRAELIADLTFPDGSTIEPDTFFTKTWRLKNTGSCEWGGYDSIVFDHGDQMDAPWIKEALEDYQTVKPGETVDVSIGMISPEEIGSYQAYFTLMDPTLWPEESKAQGDITLWVKIRVVAPTPKPSGIADIQIVTGRISIDSDSNTPAPAVCPENTRVTGGGFSHPYPSEEVEMSYMEENGWAVKVDNHSSIARVLKVHAFCLNDPNASTVRAIHAVSDKIMSVSRTATVVCPKGTVVTGGGFKSDKSYQTVFSSGPYENGWRVVVGLYGVTGKATFGFSAYAVCLSGVPAGTEAFTTSGMIEYNSSGFVIAECPPGFWPVGGGFSKPDGSVRISEASAHGGLWIVHAYNQGNKNAEVKAHVMCLKAN